MPELPDITVYVEKLNERLVSQPLERIRFVSSFLLRSVDPSISSVPGKTIRSVSRLGKRIVFELDDDLFLVLHLMISGRLRWRPRNDKVPRKTGLAAFDFPNGTLLLTEASPKKRASLVLVAGKQALASINRGGLEVMEATLRSFRAAIQRENHTLKRSLTDPRIFSGIGNAYSDEILHRARLSPVKLSKRLTDDEVKRLYHSCRGTLQYWTDALRKEAGDGFPEKVTAFRDSMAVHGKFGQPCPVCGTAVQRIRYADNETNSCPTCQTGGKLLADRGLSRLLRADWPKSLVDLEEMKNVRTTDPA